MLENARHDTFLLERIAIVCMESLSTDRCWLVSLHVPQLYALDLVIECSKREVFLLVNSVVGQAPASYCKTPSRMSCITSGSKAPMHVEELEVK